MPAAVAAWVAEGLATTGTFAAGTYTVAYSATTYAVAYAATYAATTAAIVYGTNAIASRSMKSGGAFADQGRNVMNRDPIAPQRKIYGQVPVTGPMYPIGVSGTKNEYFWFAAMMAGHKCAEMGALYFGDEALNDGGTGIPTGKYSGVAFLMRHDGWDDQTADSNVATAFPGVWTSNHRGRGKAHVIARLKYDNEIFSGLPTVRCMVKGAFVYDPRDSGQDPDDSGTWVWSANAALCAADFIHDSKFGKGVPWSRMDIPALIEAANISDEDIILVPTVTAGSFVVGQRYAIETVGTTDFTAIGASSNSVGTIFTATGAGTGSGVANNTERRYTVNGTITTDQDRDSVLGDLADAMAGVITDVGGIWTIRAGAWRTPTVTLGDGDLAGGISTQTRQSMQDTYNGVKGIFISPLNNWQPGDIPPIKNDTYMADDGGVRRWKDIALNFTTSSATAQRIEKIDLERGRQQITFTGLYKLKALSVLPGEVVNINHARFGWSAKAFEATDWALKLYDGEGGGKCLGVAITWRETASGVWDWADGEETEQDLAANTSLPNPSAISAPTGLALLTDSTTSIIQTDGTFVPRLKCSWNTPNNIYVESGGHTLIEYKKHSDSDWETWNTPPGNVLVDYITDVKVGVAYDVRIQHISGTGVRSNDGAGTLTYNTVSNYTIVGDVAAPATPTGLSAAVGTGKSVSLSWTANTEPDLFEYKLYRATVNSFASASLIAIITATRLVDINVTLGSTYYYFLTALDETGNESSATAGVSATPTTVASSSLDHTVGADPTAMTKTSQGTRQSTSDGTVTAWMQFSIPAKPSWAAGQKIYMRDHSDTQVILIGDFANTSTITDFKSPPLIPGRQIDFYTEAYNFAGDGSNLVLATSAPFTAPGDTTAPANPTSLTLVAGDATGTVRPAPVLHDGVLMYSASLTFVESTSADLDFYEVGISNSNVTDPAIVIDVNGSEFPCLKGTRRCDFWRATVATEYMWIRAVDYSGNRSAFVLVGDVSSYMKKPTGNLVEQDKTDLTVSGIKTGAAGASSVLQVHARFSINHVPTLTGGSPSEYFTVDISNRGFSIKPDVGYVQCSSDANIETFYDWSHASNTSSIAYCKAFTRDGTNIGAGPYRFNAEFTQFN